VRYERTGHLFERRYGSNRIWTPERFAAAVEYIDQNPVAAGLSATPADWPWSSAGTRAAGDPPPWLAELERVQEIWRQLVS
jgi:putative transposase